MRSPRKVTFTPIARPSRSLKFAMLVRALVTTGFWPVIWIKITDSSIQALGLSRASPMPILMTTFLI